MEDSVRRLVILLALQPFFVLSVMYMRPQINPVLLTLKEYVLQPPFIFGVLIGITIEAIRGIRALTRIIRKRLLDTSSCWPA
ncbi:hypothetical protein Sjap_023060 [Stephania japonica]|uniref:Uncharacterized protein n=1 Tax=Stephania japonica TaxID=461633 RepID=A0AAP0EVQ3_9MAGN